MSNWSLFAFVVFISLLALLILPALWSSSATPSELLRKKWKDRADQ